MAYTKENRQTDQMRTERPGGSVRSVPGGPAAALPNSLMYDLMEDASGDELSPAPLIRREMNSPVRQIPAAETEADRLSSGVRGSTPADIRREMGHRLGADFSHVRFHSGSESDLHGAQMGARAWTRGSDVYFGKGGFDPQIAAHELVHTIQQGAVSGSVSRTAPAGAVQMWPWNKKKKEDRKRHIDDLASQYEDVIAKEKQRNAVQDDKSDADFELEGLDAPEITDNIIRTGEADLPARPTMVSQNQPAGPDVPNDVMGVSGKPRQRVKEEDTGFDTLLLGGMDQVNEQEKQEILQDFESVPSQRDSDASIMPETVSGMKEINKHLGITRNIQTGTNSAAQLGMLARNHSAMEDKNLYTAAINPAVSIGADAFGIGAGLTGLVTGGFDTYKNVKRLKAGGEKSDVAASGLDTIASGAGLASGGIGMMSKIGKLPIAGGFLKSTADFTGSHTGVIPGLNVVTGGATALSGTIQAVKGKKSLGKINEQIKKLEGIRKKKGLSKNQEDLLKTFHQGRRVSELNRTSGALKALSGSVTAGTGIAALATGPLAPLTAAIAGVAGMGLGLFKFVYDKIKRRRMRADITAEEMGIDWETEMQRVRAMFPAEKLSDKEVRAIILKSHGFAEGTRTSAFKEITKRRAGHLMSTAQGTGEDADRAQKVISALGIHRKNGRYAKGALSLLEKKLG